MSFHNIVFPSFLEAFLLGRSVFSTSKVMSLSGREIRNSDQNCSRNQYLLKDCYLSPIEFAAFNNFFKARGGSRFAFLLRDFSDFATQRQILGIGNGVIKEFQLAKLYPDDVYPYIRKITKVKREGFQLYINDAEQQIFQLDRNSGIVTLPQPLEQDAILSASFEFYIIARFLNDEFSYELRPDGTIQVLDVSLIEVLE